MPHLIRIFPHAFAVALSLAAVSGQEPAEQASHIPPLSGSKSGAPSGDDAADLIRWLLDDDRNTDQIPFATIVRATAGKRILPLDQKDPVTAEIRSALRDALDATLAKLNVADSPVRGLSRINEASRFFEDEMLARLDATDGFSCGIPERADGIAQRSGYPDLRLVHTASGRITYLDPKLFETTGKDSTLRTFYFEPKKRTNKILDDAHHVLLGIEHDGNDGAWKFLKWHVVDLSSFQVRLKAEFQASNRDIYTPELTIMQSGSEEEP